MNDEMIKRFNERVQPKDTVYHLGDFAFGDPKPILDKLQGKIHLILGNHDQKTERKKQLYQSGRFSSIKEVELIEIEDQSIWLSHYPHRSWPSSSHGSWHLHGHCHGTIPNLATSYDVGVDPNDFYPISFEMLRDKLAGKKIET